MREQGVRANPRARGTDLTPGRRTPADGPGHRRGCGAWSGASEQSRRKRHICSETPDHECAARASRIPSARRGVGRSGPPSVSTDAGLYKMREQGVRANPRAGKPPSGQTPERANPQPGNPRANPQPCNPPTGQPQGKPPTVQPPNRATPGRTPERVPAGAKAGSVGAPQASQKMLSPYVLTRASTVSSCSSTRPSTNVSRSRRCSSVTAVGAPGPLSSPAASR